MQSNWIAKRLVSEHLQRKIITINLNQNGKFSKSIYLG